MTARDPPLADSPAVPSFVARDGCPFCGRAGRTVLDEVRYHETAEANPALPDVRGRLYDCPTCGIAHPSHVYSVASFRRFYDKAFTDLDYLDHSRLQAIRMAWMRRILAGPVGALSLASMLDRLSLRALQVPRMQRRPAGLRILDVGCGFGEFMRLWRDLGGEVVGTEVIPAFVQRMRAAGLTCLLGELEDLDFAGRRFDVVNLRAVFYRTRRPARTLEVAAGLLADGGEILLLDPCPGPEGVSYFFRKQFPQGQFYILDRQRFLKMLQGRFGLRCTRSQLIYGRPTAPLKRVRLAGNLLGLGELMLANLLRRKAYMLRYNLEMDETAVTGPRPARPAGPPAGRAG